jgi:hypothetical protein
MSHGAIITRAPSGGSIPTPLISFPTALSQSSSWVFNVVLLPAYHELACVAALVVAGVSELIAILL